MATSLQNIVYQSYFIYIPQEIAIIIWYTKKEIETYLWKQKHLETWINYFLARSMIRTSYLDYIVKHPILRKFTFKHSKGKTVLELSFKKFTVVEGYCFIIVRDKRLRSQSMEDLKYQCGPEDLTVTKYFTPPWNKATICYLTDNDIMNWLMYPERY